MEQLNHRLTQRVTAAQKALYTLDELAFLAQPSRIERDAAIQRFEYTVEATWKAAQLRLAIDYSIEAASPKAVIRACAQNGLLTDDDGREAMGNDRRPQSYGPHLQRSTCDHDILAASSTCPAVATVDRGTDQPNTELTATTRCIPPEVRSPPIRRASLH